MSFSAHWLARREPYDAAARNPDVLAALQTAFADAAAVAVVDLGCGTGATLRAISRHLPGRQSWRLVDHDEALLAVARTQATPGLAITTAALDLANDLEAALDGDLVTSDLVTMSALLDLVSARWLDRLIAALGRRPLYAALSYDGVVALEPATRHDDSVIAAVNRHQVTDKGFGPALGPGAATAVPDRLRAAGFAVVTGRSDWSFGSRDRDIQFDMLAGWAEAAAAMGVSRPSLDDWLAARRRHVAEGRSHMRVGHVDLFAQPIGRR